jgi:hypothetical protein
MANKRKTEAKEPPVRRVKPASPVVKEPEAPAAPKEKEPEAPVIPKEKEPEAPSTPKDKEPEAPSRTSYALPGLLPVVPVNRLYKGTYRSRNAPLNWFSDSSLEKVLDPVRLESNLRAVKFARTSSTVAEIEFVHSAGETPVAVCISSLSLPAAAKDYDIEIDVKSVDDSKITVTVKPADHGIGVGVTAFFQTAGLSGEA